VTATVISKYGTEEQKRRCLPLMATGEGRGAMALTEPQGGSDLQAITTHAVRQGDNYVINGTKTWITNARHARFLSVMAKTDKQATPPYKGISLFIAEPGPGFSVSKNLPKLGYKGVESCELAFEDFVVPAASLLGGQEGQGFVQMMNGLEVGRIQVASRSLGVARAALEDSVRYAQQRETFGKPIWQHQAIGHMLAEMATKLDAARLLTHRAALLYDQGARCDMEAGMAKYYASEVAQEISFMALRIHGGYGYSQEYNVERYYRDTPLMVVGEGTNEIQKNVIAKQLVQRNRI
jgi:alkylation response protein AidB-like acyl-CoA dehydrogenase